MDREHECKLTAFTVGTWNRRKNNVDVNCEALAPNVQYCAGCDLKSEKLAIIVDCVGQKWELLKAFLQDNYLKTGDRCEVLELAGNASKALKVEAHYHPDHPATLAARYQKLRATVHRDVKTIATETCHQLGLDMTKESISVVAELVYKKMEVYGMDLEAFARHAKRQTINSDDVKLLVRRNPSLSAHIADLAGNAAPKEKRRKTAAPVARQPETPKETEKVEISAPVVTQPPRSEDVPANTVVDVDEMIDLTFD